MFEPDATGTWDTAKTETMAQVGVHRNAYAMSYATWKISDRSVVR